MGSYGNQDDSQDFHNILWEYLGYLEDEVAEEPLSDRDPTPLFAFKGYQNNCKYVHS